MFRKVLTVAAILSVATTMASIPEFNMPFNISGVNSLETNSWRVWGTGQDSSKLGFQVSSAATNDYIIIVSGNYGDINLFKITNILHQSGINFTCDVVYAESGTPRSPPETGYQELSRSGYLYPMTFGGPSEYLKEGARNVFYKLLDDRVSVVRTNLAAVSNAYKVVAGSTNVTVTLTATGQVLSVTESGVGTITNMLSSDGSIVWTDSGGPQPDGSVTDYVADVSLTRVSTSDAAYLGAVTNATLTEATSNAVHVSSRTAKLYTRSNYLTYPITQTVYFGVAAGNTEARGASYAFNSTNIGTSSWSGATNVLIEDGNVAENALDEGPGYITELILNGFDLSAIPDDAAIRGIEAKVKGYKQNEQCQAKVYVSKGYAESSDAKTLSIPIAVGGPAVWTTNGSSSDLWGMTWTASEIKSTNFWLKIGGYNNATIEYIDYATVTIYYGGDAVTIDTHGTGTFQKIVLGTNAAISTWPTAYQAADVLLSQQITAVTAPLASFVGVSNEHAVIKTNYAPLPSYLGTSNLFDVVKTNYPPLPSYLSTSNSVKMLSTNSLTFTGGGTVSGPETNTAGIWVPDLGLGPGNYWNVSEKLYTSLLNPLVADLDAATYGVTNVGTAVIKDLKVTNSLLIASGNPTNGAVFVSTNTTGYGKWTYFPMVSAVITGSYTFPDGAFTLITFDKVDYQDGTTFNGSTWIPGKSGKIGISTGARLLQTGGATTKYFIRIDKDGVPRWRTHNFVPSGVTPAAPALTIFDYCQTTTNSYQVYLGNISGVSQTNITATTYDNFFIGATLP